MSIVAQKQLLKVARKLPEENIREVVDFAEFLLGRAAPRRKNGASRGTRALRKYIGGVRHGTLSQRIDEELYGGTLR